MAEDPPPAAASWGDGPYTAEWRWEASWRPYTWSSSWWSWSPSWWSRGYGWDQERDWRQSWNDWGGYWKKPYEDQWPWSSWQSWPPSYAESTPWQHEDSPPRRPEAPEAPREAEASPLQREQPEPSRERQSPSPQPVQLVEEEVSSSPLREQDPWKEWHSLASRPREPAQVPPRREPPDPWKDWRSSVPPSKEDSSHVVSRGQQVVANPQETPSDDAPEQVGKEEGDMGDAVPCQPVLEDAWREQEARTEAPAEPARARRLPRDITSKVFVTGLSGETAPETLGEYCQGVGEVRYVSIFMDSDSSDPNGTAKVDFDSEETAKRAIRELSGTLLDGSIITLQSLADVPAYLWQRRDNDGCAVFVSNLGTEVGRFELKAFAAEAGDVGFVRIFTDRQTGLSRGCGKVEFASLEQAQQAVQLLNGKVLAGRAVTVEPMASEGAQRRPPAVLNSHRTAFVGGLSTDMDEGGLLDLVSDIGPVTFARIFRDRQSGNSKGCGKVEFETEELMSKAVSELNGKEVNGRNITVEPFSQAHEGRPLRDAPPPVIDGRQVFLSGLSASTDSDTLRKFCELTVGPVTNARVFTHRDTGESRGTAKVEFDSPQLAQSAIQALNGRLLDGSYLSARMMERDRPLRPPAEGSCRIFIANLPDEVSEGQVQDLLQQAGEVLSVQVFKTGAGNTASRAVMASPDQAQRAVSVLNETFYISNRITVRLDAERPKAQTDATVFVGGLSFSTTSQGLEQHFSRVAKVVQASVFTAKETGKPRGSGKVEFQSARDAERAVQELNGSELDGRSVHVKIMEARPPERSGPVRPPPGLGPPDSGRQLFVSGLAPTTQTELLREFCEACLGDGSVVYCNVFHDHDTGESKCTAKLELASSDLLDRALQDLEGAQLEGGRLSLRRPGEARQPPAPDGRTIFLGGLSWDVDSEALKAFASQVGEVTYAAVFTNKETGKSKGSGKVQFATAELADKAVEELSGQDLMGREVHVRMMEAQPKKPS
ncbi:PABPC1L [Symbiodinium natans]|uniref:PABPC1L protein n=1 Tax=Symbiodinium natans TaxID=878477 RepID=A0A812GAP6_9DINO|nr:PABPC1L [Symbiodinium natans]